jgi:poly-gamma-glutamate capsule biosynthesis protein CapA/YwtB (metallophosphatase superfamily)
MRLLFVGDVMLGRLVNRALKAVSPDYPWGDTLDIIRGADLRFCNLECALSDRGSPWSLTPKMFHFRTDARNVAVLKRAGIDAVSLANNHILDFEDEGLIDTIAILDGNGIAYAGAGRNLAEAQRPALLRVRDRTIAFFAFTDNEPGWEAKPSRPGILYLPVDLSDERVMRFLGRVAEARREADLVVVSAHWGPNWGYEPPEEHVALAHALVEAGAGIVFGHSPHVVRGIEVRRGRPILYSTGDFIDDYAVDEIERNDRSFIFVVAMDESGTGVADLELYPTTIGRFQANRARGREARAISAKMQELCEARSTRLAWQERKGCLRLAPPSGTGARQGRGETDGRSWS